jgi:hypothetical protein
MTMIQRIVIPKPRDPLAGMIATYRGAYARKWRVPVEDTSQTEEARPAATSGETDAIHDNPEAFDRFIRRFLFWKEVQ